MAPGGRAAARVFHPLIPPLFLLSPAGITRCIAMFGQYAALCIASGVRTQELWTGYLSANELDQAQLVADAQATLTGQMSMHALDATGPAASLMLPSSRLGGGGEAPPKALAGESLP